MLKVDKVWQVEKGLKLMMEGFGEINVVDETSKDLKIGKSSFYKMAREGKIPVVKIGQSGDLERI